MVVTIAVALPNLYESWNDGPVGPVADTRFARDVVGDELLAPQEAEPCGRPASCPW